MQDRTGLTVFLVRVVFVLFETRRFCKVARFVFPDLIVFLIFVFLFVFLSGKRIGPLGTVFHKAYGA